MSGFKRAVFFFSALTLLTRLVFIAHFSHNPANILDVDGYVGIARSLLSGQGYALEPGVLTLERSPGFPLWIAFLFLVFGGNPLVVLLGNAVLNVVTGLLLAWLALRLFTRRCALIVLAVWSVYPFAVYYGGWNYLETFLLFLFTALLAAIYKWRESRNCLWAGGCGILAALAGLVNPAALPWIGVIPLWFFIREERSRAWRAFWLYSLLGVAVYAPWPIRNQIAFGKPVLTNIHGGLNLYQALIVSPDDLGTPQQTRDFDADSYYQQIMLVMQQRRYIEANEMLLRGSLARIKARPFAYLSSCAYRVVKLWRLYPYQRAYPYHYRIIFWISLLSDGWIIPLALLGLWGARRRWRELFPLYSAVVLWTLAYALIYAVMRYRMPVMPVMILFAAAALDDFLPWSRSPGARWVSPAGRR